jgi:alcohol dehydrogenase (cytochrome c)
MGDAEKGVNPINSLWPIVDFERRKVHIQNIQRWTYSEGDFFMKRGQSMRLCAVTAALLLLALGTIAMASAPKNMGWNGFNGNYDAARYAPLDQITTANVSLLTEVGRYQTAETTSFQTGPVVVGNMMYFTTATRTYAIDARTGLVHWIKIYTPKAMGLGTPVRGLSYANGRLYRGTPDAHVIALDAKTGNTLWDVAAGNADAGEYFTCAPVLWRGRLFLGTSGSDIGLIGRMMAFDVRDGHRLWNFDIIPSTGSAVATWPADPAKLKAGGGVYSSYALDTATGMLYIPTGNPGPDFVGDYRPGANLYTCSVLRLDAMTGVLKGYHQFVPHDVHDWDMAASPILITSRAKQLMVVAAGKNGFMYGLNRRLTHVYWSIPVATIENQDAPITAEGTHFLPGTQGGVNWYGPAYSPLTNLLYVNARDSGTTVKLGGPETLQFIPKNPFVGSANGFGQDDEKKAGQLTAVDADSGKVVWTYRDETMPLAAAVTPTAGNLLLTGDLQGNLLAFDATTGKCLLRKPTGNPIGGGIITYVINGTQYIAVASGLNNFLMGTKSGPAVMIIYALPKHTSVKKP